MSCMLWELHCTVPFLNTTLMMIVLSNIPFKYDRFIKTDKERQAENKKETKAIKKRNKKRQKRMAKQDSLLGEVN